MTPTDPDTANQQKRVPLIDFPRLGLVVGTALLILTALYLGSNYASTHGYDASLFGYGFLLLVPFVAMLVFVALCRVYWSSAVIPRHIGASAIAFALVLVLSAALLASPVLVCLAIAAPLWLVGAVAGGFASRWVIKYSHTTQLVLIGSLIVATAAVLALEPVAGYPTNHYTVSRSVEINSSPERIWPYLLKLANFRSDEGRRNFSQDVLGVPRPAEAIVHGDGIGAVRTARWQRGIWFEEHVTTWRPNDLLEWKFVFPEGSSFTAVDQHIDPRGPNLTVETGGYRLASLPGGKTRLDVFTTYAASTAVNGYSSLWGELIIGDVQSNILTIIKGRVEGSKIEPDASPSLIAAN